MVTTTIMGFRAKLRNLWSLCNHVMVVVTMVTMFFDHPENLLELWGTLGNFNSKKKLYE